MGGGHKMEEVLGAADLWEFSTLFDAGFSFNTVI